MEGIERVTNQNKVRFKEGKCKQKSIYTHLHNKNF